MDCIILAKFFVPNKLKTNIALKSEGAIAKFKKRQNKHLASFWIVNRVSKKALF